MACEGRGCLLKDVSEPSYWEAWQTWPQSCCHQYCDDCHELRVKGSQTLHVWVLCPKENWNSELEGSLWSSPRSFTDEETHVAAPWGPTGWAAGHQVLGPLLALPSDTCGLVVSELPCGFGKASG